MKHLRRLIPLLLLAVATTASAQTLTRGPLIQNPDGLTTTMTIEWWTNVAGDSRVEYGTTPSLGSSATVGQTGSCEIGAAGTCHAVQLTSLAPGTRYYYRLLTNNVEVLAVNSFQTFKAPTDTSELFFTVVGDFGSGQNEATNVANNISASDAPLLMTVGDNAYENGTQSDWDNNVFISAYRNQILRRAVFMPTLGNHDLNDVGASNWASSVEIKLHLLPRNAPAGQEERFYSFDHGDAHFVVLDVNPPAIGSTQANWLAADLAATTRKWKFVFLHQASHSCANGIASFGSNSSVKNTFGPIFEQYGVDIVFEGHDHIYERSKAVDEFGGDGLKTRYIMSGGGGKTLDSAANADGGGPYRQPLFGSKSYCPWIANDCANGVAGQYCSFAVYQHLEIRIQNDTTLTGQAVNQSNQVFDQFTIVKNQVCGDGAVQAGEACDQGAANGGPTSCCTASCQLVSGGTQCRASGGVCDPAESCDGSSPQCPADLKSTAECRGAAGDCDVAESCDGVGNNCPPDVLVSAGTTCRPSAGDCDVAESCTGSSAACPSDGFVAAGTTCRPSAGDCDPAEACTGSSAACPADGFAPSTTVCRGAVDVCDQAESCTGSSAACPADGVKPAGTGCRGSAGPCDPSEVCNGSSTACPADALAPTTSVCRPAAGLCDVAENCTGTSAACPADALRPSGFVCRSAAGICDVAEQCNGTQAQCPTNQFEPTTTVCRPAAGDCDVAESCTGTSASCPGNALKPAGTVCRAAAGVCDAAEACSGSSSACPPDGGQPDTDGDGLCDLTDDCPNQSDPSQADSDGDGTGDACDPCNNYLPVFATKPNVTISKLATPPGDDKLKFSGVVAIPTSPPIDPLNRGVRVLLTDANGGTIVDATIPGGIYEFNARFGWTINGAGTTYTYRNFGNPVPLVEGIYRVTVKKSTRVPGQVQFSVSGKSGSYAVAAAALPLKATIVLDPPYAETNQCGEAVFPGPASPTCTYVTRAGVVKCK
ncbi:MAG TPA: fibronectin type III domain-containing protein [Candidatus Binatia bacterium]|nr:fibronectin type III domain-containing protein [Candidatus Binatia bacterium]